MAKSRKKGLIVIVVLLAIIAAAVYWFMHRNQESTDDAQIDGHVMTMAPKVAGYITALNVEDNQLVKQGDIIAQIDPRDYEIAVTRAQAELDSAEAKLAGGGKNYATTKVSAPLNVSSAQAQVDAAQAELIRTQKELARIRKLGIGAFSRQELERATASEASAQSTLDDAIAKLQSSKTAPNTIASAADTVKDLQAQVELASANLAQAKKDLDDTKIVAPVDGRVTDRHVELGAYVVAGQNLLSLVANDYWVTANYKENQLREMKPGQEVTIKIDAYSAKEYKGKVDSIQRGTGARFSAFPAENATGNFVKIVQRVPVKIVFTERPDDALAVGPGMSVDPVVYTR